MKTSRKRYKILHVPKTGGTALKSSLIPGYRRHETPYLKTQIPDVTYCNHDEQIRDDAQYVVFLRDPIRRFVSHFVFYKNRGANYDTSKNYGVLTPPALEKCKNINQFVAAIDNVETPEYGQLKRGFDFALKDWEDYKDNLFFVGRMEHLAEDFEAFQIKLGRKPIALNNGYANVMPKELEPQTKLTKSTKRKLRKMLDADYKIISALCSGGFVDKDYLKEINYKII